MLNAYFKMIKCPKIPRNPASSFHQNVVSRNDRWADGSLIAAQLREGFGPLVFRTTVPHSVRVEEAHARNRTVLEFSPRSAPALAYHALVTEVLAHGEQQQGDPAAALSPDAPDAA
jgi:cellulose biosynthesis protein BcsQ